MNKIDTRQHLISKINTVTSSTFDAVALAVFRYQATHNKLYNEFLSLLNIQASQIQQVQDIPFLPISFFKTHEVKTGSWQPKATFTSSGTTGTATSQHHVKSMDWYLENTKRGWESMYGKLDKSCFLMLLPSYLEREGSSLVKMADYFIKESKFEQSAFYLNEYDQLVETIQQVQDQKIPTFLIGVSFALLDFAEQYNPNLQGITVMETGGMKGRRKEIIRSELHRILTNHFQVPLIHSEYGMTELLSQAYSKGNGIFQTCPTLSILISDITDPFCKLENNRAGIINCIDLANLDTCSFIQTADIGRRIDADNIEILGRVDNSDIRGCNLLVL